MAGKQKTRAGAVVHKEPRRGEIWLIIDRDGNKKPDGSIQHGTRTGIIVSNDSCNIYSSVVEVVYTTTQDKVSLPTHFITNSTPHESTVLCEQIDSVQKCNLKKYYGRLTADETKKLNKCLKISIDVK